MANIQGWLRTLREKVTFGGFVRLVADIVLVNLSILIALMLRLFYYLAYEAQYIIPATVDYNRTIWLYINSYLNATWLLTLICIVVFSLSGFYTYGRFYKGRYKVLIVIQAVSISYLILGLMAYFFGKGTFYLPRGAFALSWLLSIVFLVAARVWSLLLRNIYSRERQVRERPEDRKLRNILVIGGAGYIGSALLPKLLDKGYHVTLLDLLIYGREPIKDCLNHPHLKVLQADFRQIDRVVEAMHDIDAIIHLGGLVGDPACALNADLTTEINLMATRMIAEVAKGSDVARFVFASTCSVYGASDQKLDERSVLNPVSLYARSKIASEKVLLKMADEHFAPVILRFGTIYGLSGRTRFDLVVNLLTAKAVAEGEITIFGGDQWRPFVHVDDAAQALLQVIEAPLPLVRNQIFNVGSNEQNYTIRQVGEIIHGFVPEAQMVDVNSITDPRNYWVDFGKIKNSLGFVPRWTVQAGIQQVMQALQSGRVKDYRDARYSNVKFLSQEGMNLLASPDEGWAYQLLHETEAGNNIVVDM
jgi:nucleoside-diphosphate-sugar epimerase